MRSFGIRCALVVVFLGFLGSLSAQQSQAPPSTTVPHLVRISNTFHPADGQPAAPVEGVTLSIYREEREGAALWQETQNVSVDSEGRYSLLLGTTQNDGLPLELFTAGEPRWLGVRFNRPGEAEQPRTLLTSVPYALRASDAETLGGLPASAYLRDPSASSSSPGAGTAATSAAALIASANLTPNAPKPRVTSGSTGYLGMFTNATDLGNSSLYQYGTRIGLNTTLPLDYMHVAFNDGTGAFTGYAVQNLNAAGFSGMLFYDQNGALGQFQGFGNTTHEYRINNIAQSGGVYNGTINFMIGGSSRFLVASNGNIGISNSSPAFKLDVAGQINGNNPVSSGNANGVSGTSNSPNGAGVSGYNSTSGTGFPVGVAGSVAGSTGAGVQGNASVAGASGVSGYNSATSGFAPGLNGGTNSSNGPGVFGSNNATTGNGSGVQGSAASPNGAGVSGFNSYTAGASGSFPVGVAGSVNGPTGTGVAGNASAAGASGISGYNNATSGYAPGVVGGTNSPNGPAVAGNNNATSGGGGAGVGGFTNQAGNLGVAGYNNATSGYAIGVQGSTNSSSGAGVQGNASVAGASGVNGFNGAASGYAVGVSGGTASTNGAGVSGNANVAGVFGTVGFNSATSGFAVGTEGATSSPGGAGLLGVDWLCTGGAGCTLVAGEALQLQTATTGILIQGLSGAAGANNGTATQVFLVDGHGNETLAGNLTVGGTISKSGGSFRIDDPLDPDHKYLYHSFVESPDMKNIYDGVVQLDEHGEATVTLPDWFEALNQDFRYQLTCIGGYAPIYVASEVSGNRFRIAGGRSGLKVSWQLTGIRHDAYANTHRIPVEVDKQVEPVSTAP
jgi:trimeric autotransporter adhesin